MKCLVNDKRYVCLLAVIMSIIILMVFGTGAIVASASDHQNINGNNQGADLDEDKDNTDHPEVISIQTVLPYVRIFYHAENQEEVPVVSIEDEELEPISDDGNWKSLPGIHYWFLIDTFCVDWDSARQEINAFYEDIKEGDSISLYMISSNSIELFYSEVKWEEADTEDISELDLPEIEREDSSENQLFDAVNDFIEEINGKKEKYYRPCDEVNSYFDDKNNVIAIVSDGQSVNINNYNSAEAAEAKKMNIPVYQIDVFSSEEGAEDGCIRKSAIEGSEDSTNLFEYFIKGSHGKKLKKPGDLLTELQNTYVKTYRYSDNNKSHGRIRIELNEETVFEKTVSDFDYVEEYQNGDDEEQSGYKEKKEIATGMDATISDADADGQDLESKEKKGFFKKYWLFILGGGIILIGLITAIVLIVSANRKNAEASRRVIKARPIDVGNEDEEMTATSDKVAAGVPVKLDIVLPGENVETRHIRINKTAFVGRAKICEIRINHNTISRQHFIIECRDKNFYIQDLGSGNGTYLNGVKLTHIRRIEKGDRIRAGEVDITVRW